MKIDTTMPRFHLAEFPTPIQYLKTLTSHSTKAFFWDWYTRPGPWAALLDLIEKGYFDVSEKQSFSISKRQAEGSQDYSLQPKKLQPARRALCSTRTDAIYDLISNHGAFKMRRIFSFRSI
jgi:hypothetical protein